MSLREAFEQQPSAPGRARCTIAIVLDQLDADDRQTLLELLDDPLIGHTRIVRSLNAIGVDIGDSTIGRHRSGRCRCAR